MAFFAIQNFRFGLDVRRSEYTSQPGTLLTLNNCHVNEGGEIEKRQAFSIGALTTANTFGLVAGATALYVFGSVATPAGFPLTLFGKTITYLRCQHPDGATAMSAVVAQTTFSGLPFIVAQFADGNQYPFYNGVLVSDFTAGLILASLNTDTKIATAFTGLVNASTLYTATDNVNGSVDVFDNPGGNYTTSSVTTLQPASSGVIGTVNNGPGVSSVQGQVSVGQFQIVAGAAGTITSITVAGTEILGATITWTVSNSYMAQLLAKQINVYNLAHSTGYVATATAQAFVLISTTTQGSTANGRAIQVTATLDVCVSAGIFTFSYNTTPVNKTSDLGNSCVLDLDGVYFAGVSGNNLMNHFVAWGVTYNSIVVNSAANLAAVVAYQIQQKAGGTYLACAVGPTVYVSKKITSSADAAVQLDCIPVSGTNLFVTYGTANALQANITPTAGIAAYNTFAGTLFSCTVSGGQSPYSFNWYEPQNVTTNPYITPSSNGLATLTFATSQLIIFVPANSPYRTTTYICRVTDSTGAYTDSNPITVNANPHAT